MYVIIQNERPLHRISSNTFPVPGANQTPKKQEAKLYLEGLAVAATLTELLDYALELYRAEAVAGPGRPQLDLRHQERSRVAKRIQRGLQTQRPRRPWIVRAISARVCVGGARDEAGEEPAPAAAKAEQAARRREEGGGHRVADWQGSVSGHCLCTSNVRKMIPRRQRPTLVKRRPRAKIRDSHSLQSDQSTPRKRKLKPSTIQSTPRTGEQKSSIATSPIRRMNSRSTNAALTPSSINTTMLKPT
jgi:hypothetical protein